MSMPSLSSDQRNAVRMFVKERLSIVTGGPGTGKTTVVRALVERVSSRCLLLAPTGTAADRLSRSTGREAHVMKKLDYDTGSLVAEYKGGSVIIDEASMLSLDDFARVVDMLAPKRLLLIGDELQLPCVEGMPALNTLLKYERVPRTRLVNNHRRNGDTQSMLARFLSRMTRPKHERPDSVLELQAETEAARENGDHSLRIVIVYGKQQQVDACSRLFREAEACQMLTFTNAMCDLLNASTEDVSAPYTRAKQTRNDKKCRLGDRVVCLQNKYGEPPSDERADKKEEDRHLDGEHRHQEEEENTKKQGGKPRDAERNERRQALLSKAAKKNPKQKNVLLVPNGCLGVVHEDAIVYDNGFVDQNYKTDFAVCRCMTVHKSQGNEFQQTGIVCLTAWSAGGHDATGGAASVTSFDSASTRFRVPAELVYTALSRFRNNVVVVGTLDQLKNSLVESQFSRQSDAEVLARLARTSDEEKPPRLGDDEHRHGSGEARLGCPGSGASVDGAACRQTTSGAAVERPAKRARAQEA